MKQWEIWKKIWGKGQQNPEKSEIEVGNIREKKKRITTWVPSSQHQDFSSPASLPCLEMGRTWGLAASHHLRETMPRHTRASHSGPLVWDLTPPSQVPLSCHVYSRSSAMAALPNMPWDLISFHGQVLLITRCQLPVVLLREMPGMKWGEERKSKKKTKKNQQTLNETEQIILQFNFPSPLIMVLVSCWWMELLHAASQD